MKLSSIINVLVLEQEAEASSHLMDLLAPERDIHLIGPAPSADSLHLISNLKPDVLFIGSELTHRMAVTVEPDVAPSPLLVVTGTTTSHAIRAFELGAIDFLVRPFSEQRLQITLARLRAEVERRKKEASLSAEHLLDYADRRLAESTQAGAVQRVPIQFGRRYRFINVLDICYVTARGAYVTIKTATGQLLNASDSISAMERRLPPNLFLRINRSAIVNSLFVQEVVTGNRSRKVFLKDQSVFTVGTTYRSRFNRFLKADGPEQSGADRPVASFDHFQSFIAQAKASSSGTK
jgi:DNA-binding LytR/AlgR family response regulator